MTREHDWGESAITNLAQPTSSTPSREINRANEPTDRDLLMMALRAKQVGFDGQLNAWLTPERVISLTVRSILYQHATLLDDDQHRKS
jgi:hypothetical protein